MMIVVVNLHNFLYMAFELCLHFTCWRGRGRCQTERGVLVSRVGYCDRFLGHESADIWAETPRFQHLPIK
jgi:hypothetical protein